VTPERSQRVHFSRPYFTTELVVLVREEPSAPASLNALDGRKVAGAPGTTSERAIRQLLPHAVGVFDSFADRTSADRLLAGEVDAVVMDGPAAEAALSAHPGRMRRLPGLFTTEHYALALPRNRGALKDQIDACLRTLEIGGSLERFNGQYGLKEISTAQKPN
jgi:polar amino acid transport system substrate-binding protein